MAGLAVTIGGGMIRLVRATVLALALLLTPTLVALAHNDACHVWHACQPDPNGVQYVCGDLGYFDYCTDPVGSHTTLVDYQPPQPRLSNYSPPPAATPIPVNPTGAVPPAPTPSSRAWVQEDCNKDEVSPAVGAEIDQSANDESTVSGCLLPITDPPYP
jgi:hypothetical protein